MDEVQEQRGPGEITVEAAALAYLNEHPELMAQADAAAHDGGTAALIEWLDARGLGWRPGGSTPLEAFGDAFAQRAGPTVAQPPDTGSTPAGS